MKAINVILLEKDEPYPVCKGNCCPDLVLRETECGILEIEESKYLIQHKENIII